MVGFNKVLLPAADGKPERPRVEMQMMDSSHLKCIVLELSDGADGGIAAWEIKWNERKARGSLPAVFLAAYPGTPFEFISRENMTTFLA